MVALFSVGAYSADAHVVMDGGARAHPRPPGRALQHQTGILASPSPVAVPTPVLIGGSDTLSAAQVASFAAGAGFPEWAIPTMVGYAARESGFNAHAINPVSGACGLWQAYPCYGGIAWLDPATNAAVAYAKFQASGFAPWGG